MTDVSPLSAEHSTANGVYCNYCGATPAATVNLRAHRGLLIVMQFRKASGPFCRDCGLATFRRMTGESLWQGGWGIVSFIANPLTILWNLYCRYEIGQLPPPIPGSPYQPMDPGKPLYRRPQILAVLLPFLAIAGIIAAAGSDPNTKHSSYSTTGPLSDTYPSTIRTPIPSTTFTAGQCVWNTHQPNSGQDDDNANVQVLPCGDPRAQATVLGTLSRPAPTPGFPQAPGSTDSESAETLCGSAYPDSDAYYTETRNTYNLQTTLVVCLRTK